MSNNEFDGPNAPLDDEHEFKESPSFKEVWQNSPMLKLLVVGAGLVVVVGFIMFGGDDGEIARSNVKPAADVNEVVGAAVDEQYEKAIKEADRQRLEAAQQNQESFIPTPRGALKSRLLDQVEEDTQEEEDPLLQWRRRAEQREKERQERLKQQRQERISTTIVKQNKQEARVNEKDIEKRIELMAEQMQSILEGRAPGQTQSLTVTVPISDAEIVDAGGSSDGSSIPFETEDDGQEETIIIPAGEIFYGQMITTANSDVDGPILANIYSGPLRGARLIGSFTKTDTDLLVLRFDKIVIDGLDFDIDAVAVDPATTSPGLATDVDHHWLTRVILPGAASFIKGIAEAYAEQENTVVVTGETVTQETEDLNTTGKIATGVAESADIVGDLLEDEADKREDATVIVASGTPIGILFTEALTD